MWVNAQILTVRSRLRLADTRRTRPRGRSSGLAPNRAPRHVPAGPRSPSARSRRTRRRGLRACTPARLAYEARRAECRETRAAARSDAHRREQPRGDGFPPATRDARARPGSLRTAALGPARLDLVEDALAELVARTRQRERGVCVEALEAAAPSRASDAVRQRGAAVGAGHAACQFASQAPLLLVSGGQTRRERRVGTRRIAPTLDSSGGFEPRHGRDEMAVCAFSSCRTAATRTARCERASTKSCSGL